MLSKGCRVLYIGIDSAGISYGTCGWVRERWGPDKVLVKFDGQSILHTAVNDALRPVYDGNKPITWEAMKDVWIPKEQA